MWQDIKRKVLISLGNGQVPTRVVMSRKALETFAREQRRMKSFNPVEHGQVVMDMIPKSVEFSIDEKKITMVIQVSDRVGEEEWRLDYAPLILNPLSARME